MSMNVALITGGNRGIGFEICRQLGKEGFNVILTARDAIKGKRATEKLVNMDLKVEFHKLDVTNTNDIDEIVDYVNKTYKKLDILVNNAGISLDSKTILDVEMET
ncbi:MAG: SDR family NAD(P)-dependent oxidoreductase, partial [Promethearchaeota archaeon]